MTHPAASQLADDSVLISERVLEWAGDVIHVELLPW
jgi:hypothetical protein